MRSTFFLVMAMLCLQVTLSAQFYGGLKVGVNHAIWRTNDAPEEIKLVSGGYLGIPIHIPLSEQLSLVTGFGFLQKGAKLDLIKTLRGTGIEKAWAKTRVIYGDIPVSFQYQFKENGFYIRPGISLGHAFHGQIKAFASDGMESVTDTQDLQFEQIGHKRFDFNAILGAGYTIPIPTGKLLLEGMLQFGLLDVSDIPEEKLYNNGGLLSLTYLRTIK